MENEELVEGQFILFQSAYATVYGKILQRKYHFYFGTKYSIQYLTLFDTIRTVTVDRKEIEPIYFEDIPKEDQQRWMIGVMKL
jgi:hypothetical protein